MAPAQSAEPQPTFGAGVQIRIVSTNGAAFAPEQDARIRRRVDEIIQNCRNAHADEFFMCVDRAVRSVKRRSEFGEHIDAHVTIVFER